jgi:hypothetical protein
MDNKYLYIIKLIRKYGAYFFIESTWYAYIMLNLY